jgi:hypothetical protein
LSFRNLEKVEHATSGRIAKTPPRRTPPRESRPPSEVKIAAEFPTPGQFPVVTRILTYRLSSFALFPPPPRRCHCITDHGAPLLHLIGAPLLHPIGAPLLHPIGFWSLAWERLVDPDVARRPPRGGSTSNGRAPPIDDFISQRRSDHTPLFPHFPSALVSLAFKFCCKELVTIDFATPRYRN